MKNVLIIISMACISMSLYAQSPERIQVGKPFPNFELNDILYYKTQSITTSELKGQYLIFDFFNKNCSACIVSWPHTNAMQIQFKGKIQFFLVGESTPQPDWWKSTRRQQIDDMRKMYLTFRKKLRIDLPAALDTHAYDQLGISGGPILVWIDSLGIVKAISSTKDLNKQNLERFINNEPIQLLDEDNPVVQEVKAQKLDSYLNKLHQLDSNFNAVSYSVISRWDTSLPIEGNWPRFDKRGWLDIIGSDIRRLYQYAYFNSPAKRGGVTPVLSLKDSILFNTDCYHINQSDQKYIYNYSLHLPALGFSEQKAREELKHNLDSYLGYSSRLERRMAPYFKLVATEKARLKLKAKAEDTLFYREPIKHAVFSGTIPISRVITNFRALYHGDLPIVDETDILGNINITIKANLLDFDDLRRAYHEQGLDLVKGYKMMDVLVIRDAEPDKK